MNTRLTHSKQITVRGCQVLSHNNKTHQCLIYYLIFTITDRVETKSCQCQNSEYTSFNLLQLGCVSVCILLFLMKYQSHVV